MEPPVCWDLQVEGLFRDCLYGAAPAWLDCMEECPCVKRFVCGLLLKDCLYGAAPVWLDCMKSVPV